MTLAGDDESVFDTFLVKEVMEGEVLMKGRVGSVMLMDEIERKA